MPYPRLTEYTVVEFPTTPGGLVIRAEIDPQQFLEADMTPDQRRAGRADREYSRVGGRRGRLRFTTELRGRHIHASPGSVAVIDNPLYYDRLLEGCAFQGTRQIGVSYTYALTDDVHLTTAGGDLRSLALGVYYDGLVYILSNAVGTCTFRFPVNEPAKIDWEFIGAFAVNPAELANPAITEGAIHPLICTGATLTLEAKTFVYRNLEVNIGAILQYRPDIASTYGYTAPVQTRRDACILTGEIEAPDLANQDIYTWFDNRTPLTLSFTLGTVGGNIITFTGDFILEQMPEGVETDGIMHYRITGKLDPTAFFSLVCT